MIKPNSQKILSPEEIGDYMRRLRTELPAKPTLHNYPFEYFYQPDVTKLTPSAQQEYQAIADKMCEFLLLPFKVKVLLIDGMNSGGKFEKFSNLQHIFINSDHRLQSQDQKLAALAHEITHTYLFHHGIFIDDGLQNEILTDIAAVYLGFGSIMLSGYHTYFPGLDKKNKKEKIDPYTQITLGYVNVHSMLTALVLVVKARKQNPVTVIKKVKRGFDRFRLRIHLHGLIKEYKKTSQGTGKSTDEGFRLAFIGTLETLFKLSGLFPLHRKEIDEYTF